MLLLSEVVLSSKIIANLLFLFAGNVVQSKGRPLGCKLTAFLGPSGVLCGRPIHKPEAIASIGSRTIPSPRAAARPIGVHPVAQGPGQIKWRAQREFFRLAW
jgi:hypothetical protein